MEQLSTLRLQVVSNVPGILSGCGLSGIAGKTRPVCSFCQITHHTIYFAFYYMHETENCNINYRTAQGLQIFRIPNHHHTNCIHPKHPSKTSIPPNSIPIFDPHPHPPWAFHILLYPSPWGLSSDWVTPKSRLGKQKTKSHNNKSSSQFPQGDV